jgi:hypothetical protein
VIRNQDICGGSGKEWTALSTGVSAARLEGVMVVWKGFVLVRLADIRATSTSTSHFLIAWQDPHPSARAA